VQRAQVLEEFEDACGIGRATGVVVVDAGVEGGAPLAVEREAAVVARGIRRG
jgi:hypothetical protein